MKKSTILWQALLATSSFVIPSGDNQAGDSFLNDLTFSGMVGLNIDAKYGPRVNASGGDYNYLDGYVLPDSSGGANPNPGSTYPTITHYWGYDNSARQVNDSTDPNYSANFNPALPNQSILFTQSAGGNLGSRAFDNDPRLGLELSFDRELGEHGKWTYGVEAALNYMHLCLHEDGTSTGQGSQVAYPYFFPSVVNSPPLVYQGTPSVQSGSPNFEIGNVPNPIAGTVPVSVTENDQLDADIWGFRLGPYLQHPLGQRGMIRFSGGLAAVLVDASGSWMQQLTVNGIPDPAASGSGSGTDVLWGYYVGATASYDLSKRWAVNAGVKFQDTGTYKENFGGRLAEIDLSQSVYITVGVSFKF
jgi:hypothetical protein